MKSRSKGIALSYVQLIVNLVCGLFLSSYLIKKLGDTEYGIYQTVSSFANYLILLEFGTGTVMTQTLSACRGKNATKEKMNEAASTIWCMTNILAAIITAASIVMFFSLDNAYSESFTAENIKTAKSIFVLVIVNLIVAFYSQSFSGITLSFERYSFAPMLKTVLNLVKTVLIGVLVLKFKYAEIIVAVDIFVSFVKLFSSYLYCKKNFQLSFKFKYFNSHVFKGILPFSIALFLQTLINQANNNVDKMFIGMFISPEAVTLYSVPVFIYNIFSSIGAVPCSMYSTKIVKDISSGEPASSLIDKYISAGKLTALICGSVLFGFIAVGKPFINLFYGREYMDAWVISIILMLPSFFSVFLDVLTNVLDVLGKRIVFTVVLAGSTALNVLLTLVLIGEFGYFGAVVATAVCVVAQLIFMVWYYTIKIKIKVIKIYAECFRSIIPFQGIACVAGYGVSSWISCATKPLTVCSLLCGGATYVVVFGALYLIFDKEAKKFVRNILKKQ